MYMFPDTCVPKGSTRRPAASQISPDQIITPHWLEAAGPDPDNLFVALTRDDKQFAFPRDAEMLAGTPVREGKLCWHPPLHFSCS
jgi:hypothetical protein